MTREFQEWGKGIYNRLPTPIRNGLKAAGVCHYMVVVRDGPGGDLYSFDFGPVGGDVTGALSGGVAGFPEVAPAQLCFDDVVPGSLPMRRSQSTPALFKEAPEEEADEPVEILAAAKDPAAAAATDGSSSTGAKSRRRRPLGRREKKWVVGEIREHKIDELPEGTHFLGTTEMTLDDIRDFNAGRNKMYALHDNDCRHYMNDLCERLVPELEKYGRGGVASKVAWDATWGRLRSGRPEIHLLPIQAMADLRNQPALERIKTASMASVMFSLGMRALPIVFKPILPLATAVSNAGGARRLVTTAAGAVAGVSSEVPIVREALYAGNVAMESLGGWPTDWSGGPRAWYTPHRDCSSRPRHPRGSRRRPRSVGRPSARRARCRSDSHPPAARRRQSPRVSRPVDGALGFDPRRSAPRGRPATWPRRR